MLFITIFHHLSRGHVFALDNQGAENTLKIKNKKTNGLRSNKFYEHEREISTGNSLFSQLIGKNITQNPLNIGSMWLLDSENNKLELRELAGRITIMYFWASWCLESIQGLKQLEHFQQQLRARSIDGIRILPINLDNHKLHAVLNIYRQYNLRLIPAFFAQHQIITEVLPFNNVPYAIVLNSSLEVMAQAHGNVDWNYELNSSLLNTDEDHETIDLLARPSEQNIMVFHH